MEFAFYQRFKDAVTAAADGMPHDVFHAAIGPGLYFLVLLLMRRPLTWWPALLPGFVLSVAMEVMDLSYSYTLWHWFPWPESVWDIAITNATPLLICLLARNADRRRLRTRSPGSRPG